MLIKVSDPIFQTIFFTVLFLAAVMLTAKKSTQLFDLNHSHTNELKGLSILMVIFGHTGYFLSSDPRFLYPLSIASGVGVNLFLFLSGFGLTISSLKSQSSILKFYLKRLQKIFIPMWIVLLLLLILDYLLLSKSYPLDTTIYSFLGWFPKADIYTSLNSPLWYFTLIFFYYLIFPLLFFKRWPIISAALILLLSFWLTNLNLPVDKDVLKLYKLHYLAFPLGMSWAILLNAKTKVTLIGKILKLDAFRYFLMGFLIYLFGFTAVHSGVGEGLKNEQLISLITMFSLVLISFLKEFQSRFLVLLGVYSYEIYLLQWPLQYRYDFLYKYLPGSLATLLYLGVFIILGVVLNRLVKLILKSN
jgi:peptidoglycan/LPS O-acetylase OafA/YrhL